MKLVQTLAKFLVCSMLFLGFTQITYAAKKTCNLDNCPTCQNGEIATMDRNCNCGCVKNPN